MTPHQLRLATARYATASTTTSSAAATTAATNATSAACTAASSSAAGSASTSSAAGTCTGTGTGSERNNAAQVEKERSFPYQIQLCVTIPKQPGSTPQQLHRDGDLSLLDFAALSKIDHATSVIWSLDDDFTEERGSTRVVLGSHLWPPARQVLPEESIPVVMKRGSALFYTGRTLHGAGHNVTSTPRIAMNTAYNLSCLKQEENQYVAVPPSIADGLPKMMQKLIGYN